MPARYVVAKMLGRQVRMFTGRYDDSATSWLASPVTTGCPDYAKIYDDQLVAEAMARTFNLLDSAYGGQITLSWVAMTIPAEALAS